MESIAFSPPTHNQKVVTHLPKELATCKRVWVRIDRIKKPLEAPYAGPYEVVKRYDNYFTIKFSSGKTENVSLHRLKPVVDVSVNSTIILQRRSQLLQSARLLHQSDIDLPPTFEPCVTESDSDNEASDRLMKERKIHKVRFTDHNEIRYIGRYGAQKPVVRRSHTVKHQTDNSTCNYTSHKVPTQTSSSISIT